MIENEKTRQKTVYALVKSKDLYIPEERKVQEKFLMGFTLGLNTRS